MSTPHLSNTSKEVTTQKYTHNMEQIPQISIRSSVQCDITAATSKSDIDNETYLSDTSKEDTTQKYTHNMEHIPQISIQSSVQCDTTAATSKSDVDNETYLSDTSKEATTQKYKHNMEHIPQISIQSSVQYDTTAATSKSDVDNEKEELKRKLKEANEKLKIANRVIDKSEETKRNLMQRIRKLNSQKKIRIEKRLLKSWETLHKVFNSDQIQWLQTDSSRRGVYKWSEETIRKALRIKFCCSENGYKELIQQNIPLPSTRTLRRSIETINFQPGICDDIVTALRDKVSQFQDDREKNCMLALDEISLAPGEQNDPSENCVIGYATIPNSRGKSMNSV